MKWRWQFVALNKINQRFYVRRHSKKKHIRGGADQRQIPCVHNLSWGIKACLIESHQVSNGNVCFPYLFHCADHFLTTKQSRCKKYIALYPHKKDAA